jgi:hypothetical protein
MLSGCSTGNNSAYTDPVYFYFPREDLDLYSQEEALDFEIREGSVFEAEMELIKAYFEGPQRYDLYSPFPLDGEVLDCSISGARIRITLSAHYNQLIGLQLTIATSCLALTLLSSRDLSVVEINILADDGTVARSFSLSRDNIILGDSYVALPAE